MPVLLTSGYSDVAQAADGRFEILGKPFELSALERTIEQAVGRGRERAQRRAV
jgi:DNA-binding NtrC family response regulator